MALIAAVLFAVGFVVRLLDGTATLHDPWVYAFLGLFCLSLAGGIELPSLGRKRQ